MNVRPSQIILVFCVVNTLIAGCALTSPHFIPVRDSKARLENAGYSVLPPQGEDWYLMRPSPGTIAFGKRAQTAPHTFSTAVISAPFTLTFKTPEEFREFVMKGKKADTDPRRFTILEYRDSLDNRFGSYCVKYYMKSEDREAQVSSVDTQFIILEISGYIFIHPSSPNLVIDVNYSERYKKGESDPKFKEIGEKFIDGFQTTSVK